MPKMRRGKAEYDRHRVQQVRSLSLTFSSKFGFPIVGSAPEDVCCVSFTGSVFVDADVGGSVGRQEPDLSLKLHGECPGSPVQRFPAIYV